VSAADRATPVSDAEAAILFDSLRDAKGLVLAVSGGPDSTALLLLAARWRQRQKHGPALLAVTVDHGLRPEAHAEAEAVKRMAKQSGVAHRMMRWTGRKPKSGLQKAAREARYRLLAEAARKIGADYVLTAHTRDDQAETVLIRMSRGSGITGLGGMTSVAPFPVGGAGRVKLVRPLLDLPKARLTATVAAAGLEYADDPSNRDPRFTRARLRAAMPALAREGLTAARLAQLARRLQRAEVALEVAVVSAWTALAQERTGEMPVVTFGDGYLALPEEVQVRLLGRAIAGVGDEGPVELGKLEALHSALVEGHPRLRRTLAGAIVTRDGDRLIVERAPARRKLRPARARRTPLNHGATLQPQPGQTALK